jgi:hypothetical protein
MDGTVSCQATGGSLGKYSAYPNIGNIGNIGKKEGQCSCFSKEKQEIEQFKN